MKKKNVIALVLVSALMLVMVPMSVFGVLSFKQLGDVQADSGSESLVGMVGMVVFARDVKVGEVINKERLTVVKVPERYACSCSVEGSLLEEVVGKVARENFSEGASVPRSVFEESKCR